MELLGTNLEYLNCAVLETLYCFMILNSHFTTMPPKRNRRNNNSRATPYDMSNINNWYMNEQFWAKLAEWNITAPASYTKAELKSLYMANLRHRSHPNQAQLKTPRQVSMAQVNLPIHERQGNMSSMEMPQLEPLNQTPCEPQNQIESISCEAQNQTQSTHDAAQNSMVLNMMSTMNSLVKKSVGERPKRGCRQEDTGAIFY